jgi:hypothetical protein
MKAISMKARFARRFPDPVHPSIERHVMFVAVTDVPPDIPREPNPREQNIDRGIWKDIRLHLLNQEGVANSFHLKNKGITIIADRVEKKSDDIYELVLDETQGIVDGGHTYQLIQDSLDDIRQHNEDEESEINQYVKIEVVTGLDSNLIVEVAGGLNTAIQVQKMSLHNLDKGFDWIKAELKDKPYFDEIAFRENEKAAFDARDIVAIMELFNVEAFPDGAISHPVRAYMSKAAVLDNFIDNPQQYKALRPILHDILVLHDTVRMEAMDLYNALGGKRAGSLAFVEARKKGKYQFPFLLEEGEPTPESAKRLSVAALYPMLAAFRSLVKIEHDKATWKIGSFDAVLELWRQVGGNLMLATQDTNEDVGRKANAIGRNKNHWRTLYGILQTAYLRGKEE